MPQEPVMLAGAAEHLGLEPWKLARLLRAGTLTDVPKVAGFRVFSPADLSRLAEQMRAAGIGRPGLPAGVETR